MARPRKNNDTGAEEKLEAAFLDLLGEKPFEKITISSLIQKAHVNRNSFYYHYACLDEMAETIFLKYTQSKLSQQFFQILLNGNTEEISDDIWGTFLKIHLYAKNQSPYLNRLISDALKQSWLRNLKIAEAALKAEDQLILAVITATITSLLSQKAIVNSPQLLQEFPKIKIGHSLAATFSDTAERYRIN